jgi:hypothetical protein
VKFRESVGVETFALYDLIWSKKRGIYFLNVFNSNFAFLKKRKIFEKIFKISGLEFPRNLFEKNLF